MFYYVVFTPNAKLSFHPARLRGPSNIADIPHHRSVTMFPPLAILSTSLLLYHFSEFVFVHHYTPQQLSPSSLLLSPPYIAYTLVSLFEYHVTYAYKSSILALVQPPAILMLLVGEGIRKLAWLTAQQAFTHHIMTHRRTEHVLVTNGIYKYCRHPGYLGWFIWALGTQVLLANPFSLILYLVTSWKFFKQRIQIEEYYLKKLFPHYQSYRLQTPTLIPFIA